ncbi:sirohydrochlorin cobaltochelatase [Deltaproteobacteria bacterium Smac51]|nr:sirohydrochlorin cobaltochelatase [Deltaproteobacteria bacterium Smac51]
MKTQPSPAIVLAAFGTSDPEALTALINIKQRVALSFPNIEVRLAFTSGFIRRIWRKRSGDCEFQAAHPGLDDFYGVLNPLSTLAALQENGPCPVLVQSLHVAEGSEYLDLKSLVEQLAGIRTQQPSMRPFPLIALGEPALGDGSANYISRAAEALGPLAFDAVNEGGALVLMGHGNEHMKMTVYGDLERELRRLHGPHVHIGLVEGEPGPDRVLEAVVKGGGVRRVVLAPLMVVAGEHAKKDMAAEGTESWAGKFKSRGFEVSVRLTGLGSLDSWADIYVEHLKRLAGELK